MDDRLQKLAEKAKGLPKTPGVYLMKDDTGATGFTNAAVATGD